VGWGIAAGGVLRDIEGWGTDIDINAGKVSPVLYFDDQGINGFALGIGPGLGGSFSVTNTRTFTVDDLLKNLRAIARRCN
jgi:hypothetical protein